MTWPTLSRAADHFGGRRPLRQRASYATAPHLRHITGYSHGRRNLAKVLVLLMMLAFLIDQIQQLSGWLFGWIWKKLGTKMKLWGIVRSLFSVLEFDSMRALYRHLRSLYQLQLE